MYTDKLAFSIAEFCDSHGISRAFLYQLWARGEGPKPAKIGRRAIITTESAARWRDQISPANPSATPTARKAA